MMSGIDFEICRVMVHGVGSPDGCVVAHHAIVGEYLCYVVWIRNLLELCRMTLVAIRIGDLIIIVDVARNTRHRQMASGQ